MQQRDELLRRFVEALGPGDAVRAAGEAVVGRYAEPHRGYHDQQHLLEVLRGLDLLGGAPPAVVCAAFWHDAVYDPRAPDNEQRSADLARAGLTGLGRPAAFADEVARLVLLTAAHAPDPADLGGALLSDADLAVLAAPPDRYAAYVAGVRHEYAHLSDDAFAAGRAAVLRSLVDRPRLYVTADGRRRWEAAARLNVQRELAGAAGADPRP